jgi:hypothetical protein
VPGGAVSGNASLVPDDRINLDSGSINAASSDLVFKINAQDKLMLSPQSGALFAVMDFNQPAQATCATAALSANPITVTNLNSGQFVCYKTDKGRVGWMQMVSLNETTNTLVFQYYTWLNP